MQSHGSGVGIRGMRERVRHFGGEMNIESNREGTRISFKFPLPKNGASREDAGVPESAVAQVQVPG